MRSWVNPGDPKWFARAAERAAWERLAWFCPRLTAATAIRAVQTGMESRGIGGARDAAIGGLQRASRLMDKAAAQVANVALERQDIAAGPAATVDISPQAKALANSDPTADIADGFVNQSVAKALNAANVKVLQTTDETLAELTRRR